MQQTSSSNRNCSDVGAGGSSEHQVVVNQLGHGAHRVSDAMSENVTVGEEPAAAVNDDDWGDFVS